MAKFAGHSKAKALFALVLFVSSIPCPIFAEKFLFQYNAGNSYRILSSVHEDVYINSTFSHHAEIVNRISITETGFDGEWGDIDATFMVTEESSAAQNGTATFRWGEEYNSAFRRSVRGEYDIGDEYFMPVVRNVPVFPDRDLKPGDTWQMAGEEAHDLRGAFGITKPFKVPFVVDYKYEGVETVSGVKLHKITARYTMDFSNENAPLNTRIDYPYNTLGFSNQTIYWNNETGTIHSYSEDFRIVIETAYGTLNTFEGTAHAEVTMQQRVSQQANIEDVESKLKDLGIENAQVTETDKGLTISIENIQFKADSAVLQESEKLKLQKIAQILQQYPDNDLLVSGHTALAGTASSRQRLSEERAEAVAAYLIELGVKDAHHVFSKGYGAEQPVAENNTEAGRARNRRVEITILNK